MKTTPGWVSFGKVDNTKFRARQLGWPEWPENIETLQVDVALISFVCLIKIRGANSATEGHLSRVWTKAWRLSEPFSLAKKPGYAERGAANQSLESPSMWQSLVNIRNRSEFSASFSCDPKVSIGMLHKCYLQCAHAFYYIWFWIITWAIKFSGNAREMQAVF